MTSAERERWERELREDPLKYLDKDHGEECGHPGCTFRRVYIRVNRTHLQVIGAYYIACGRFVPLKSAEWLVESLFTEPDKMPPPPFKPLTYNPTPM